MNYITNYNNSSRDALVEKGTELLKDPNPLTKIAAVGVITIGALVYVATRLNK